jgi:hypothetical protein
VRRLIASLLLLAATASSAADLMPILENGRLGAEIEDLAFPDKLPKELTSGLTNRILIRITLVENDQAPGVQRAVEVAVRYDLWEEHFITTTTLDGAVAEARTIASLDELRAMLRRMRLPALFQADNRGSASRLRLTADVLLNPIDRERMEMIRKWVAENSIGPGDVEGRTASDNMSVVIFNRIFEQYAKGAEVAAVWHETLSSRPFRLNELTNERR